MLNIRVSKFYYTIKMRTDKYFELKENSLHCFSTNMITWANAHAPLSVATQLL